MPGFTWKLTEEMTSDELRSDSEESSDDDDSDVDDEFDGDEADDDDDEVDAEEEEVEDDDESEQEDEQEDEEEVKQDGQDDTNEVSSEDLSEDEQENSEDNTDTLDDTLTEGNTGWADAMSKVLNMGKNSDKPVSILSKAKKDNVKRKKVEKKEGENKENEGESDSLEEEEQEEPHIPVSVRRAKKREIDSVCCVKPDVLQRARERALVKVATRGVVQLFNAVREQQKNVKQKLKQAGNSRTREKILKNLDKDGFLAVLDGKRPTEGPVSKKPKVEPKVEDEEQDGSQWSALREDFMLGAKMKDWDKESDEELINE